MVKTSKLKTATKHSLNSRHARQLAKSQLDDPKPTSTSSPPPPSSKKSISNEKNILAPVSTGIAKRSKTPLKRKQRIRQAQGRNKAEAFREKTATRLGVSLGREATVKGRSRRWEEINRDAETEIENVKGKIIKDGEHDNEDDEDAWVDDSTKDDEAEATTKDDLGLAATTLSQQEDMVVEDEIT